MDSYVTGTAIRQLREAKHLTQSELAEKLAAARTLAEVEDIYRPYRPKRKNHIFL